jgi:hypothetical protein
VVLPDQKSAKNKHLVERLGAASSSLRELRRDAAQGDSSSFHRDIYVPVHAYMGLFSILACVGTAAHASHLAPQRDFRPKLARIA